MKFTDTPGNLHLEFAYSGTDCLAYEVVFKISEIFIIIPSTTDVQNKVSLVRFDCEGEVILNPEIVRLIEVGKPNPIPVSWLDATSFLSKNIKF